MKHMTVAAAAACLAMLTTSGIVAFATAAPEPHPVAPEAELVAHLDSVIRAQLDAVKTRLVTNAPP